MPVSSLGTQGIPGQTWQMMPESLTITNGPYQQVTPAGGPSQWFHYGQQVPSNPFIPQLPATPQVAPQNEQQRQTPNAPAQNPAPVASPAIGGNNAQLPFAPGQSPLGLAITNGPNQSFTPYQGGSTQQFRYGQPVMPTPAPVPSQRKPNPLVSSILANAIYGRTG